MTQRKSIALYRRNFFPLPTIEEQNEYWLYSHSEFDTKGNLTEQSVYSQNGSLIERVVKEYDINGFLVHEKYFGDDGEASDEKSYERDDKGMIIKEFKHYVDKSFDTSTYEYDKQHRICRIITTNDDGEKEQEMINEYRDDFLLKTQVIDGQGNLLQLNEFRYDEQGNSVEHKWADYENGENSHIITSYNSNGRKKEEISYDEDGDIISQTTYTEDEQGLLLSIASEGGDNNTLTNFSYDNSGNAVYQEDLDAEENILMKVQRKFDQENNIVSSEVFIEGRGRNLPQHYEIKFEYVFYEEP